jgi:fermentation-respiration switch protein FrsA (DUF1100 family)
MLAAAAVAVPIVSLDVLTRRAARRLIDAPRIGAEESGLGPTLDALGGEVVRIRSRDGLRLSGRWLAAEPDPVSADAAWRADPREAILLLHGWSGSVAPDLVEYGPFLRRTAGVLGLDFRGHGDSEPSPTTFGLREVEDVAGALAWLGERGIERVALFGRWSSVVANRLFDTVTRILGGDPRDTEPIRVVGLLEDVALLLISGEDDATVPLADALRLATAAPPGMQH